jgi:hypothetical protein
VGLVGALLAIAWARTAPGAPRRRTGAARSAVPAGGAGPAPGLAATRTVELGPVLRPRLGWPVAARAALAVGPLLVMVATGVSPGSAAATWVLAGALLAAGSLAGLVALRTSRLAWDAAGLTRVDVLGRERRYPRAAIAGARRRSISDGLGRRRYLSFTGPDGAEVLRLVADYWGPGRLDAFCVRTGIPVSGDYD